VSTPFPALAAFSAAERSIGAIFQALAYVAMEISSIASIRRSRA
jgi:hypothetical protein